MIIFEVKISDVKMKKNKVIALGVLFFSFSTLFAQVHFDADFESGNINTVTQVDSNEYEVTTRRDIGGRWFYFRITGVKDKEIGVTVTSSDVDRPMYSYDDKSWKRFTKEEAPYINYFRKKYERDTVYVAYYIPYTFSYLQSRIAEWRKSPFVIEVDTLGYGEKGLPLQELLITDPFTPDTGKIQVWIHARTHPGETPSSYQFDGIVQTLLSNDPVVQYYREKVEFHLIPFVNPEGVYYGNSRTNPEGVDLEREWAKSDEDVAPEVKALRRHMQEVNAKRVISVFQNLHSQASNSCTFWIHTASSTSEKYYRIEHQYANLATSDISYFNKDDYSYSNLHRYFPEGYLWDHYKDKVLALTYETPYDYYSDGEEVTNENLYAIGQRTVYAIGEYLKLSHPRRIILDNEDAVVTGIWQKDTCGTEFFGDYFLTTPAGDGSAKIVYLTDSIDEGDYDVYAWYPVNENFAFDANFQVEAGGEVKSIEKTEKTAGGQWNFLTGVELTRKGQIKITLTNKASGTVAADAFRIIYRGKPNVVESLVQIKDFSLAQNYPNPFNPATRISFKLNKPGNVKLEVFNSLGQKIAVLENEYLSPGHYEVVFDADKYPALASGVYYYRLDFNGESLTKPMVLLK